MAQQNYVEQVRKLIVSPEQLKYSEDVVGVHGTSVEAILILAERGKLLSFDETHQQRQLGGALTSVPGYLYFEPFKGNVKGTVFYDDLQDNTDDIMEEIKGRDNPYSQNLAIKHFLVSQLGFVPKRTGLGNLTDAGLYDIELDKLLEECKERKIKKYDERWKLLDLIDEAFKRSGVVIGLSNRVLEFPSEHDPDDFGRAMRIYCSDGLLIEYIAYIFPLSEIDQKALESGLVHLASKS